MIRHGDCLDVMAAMEPESVDAIVTDPPYGLEFMGKEWDRLGPNVERLDGRRTLTDGGVPTRKPDSPGGRHAARVAAPAMNPRCASCGHYKFSGTPCRCDAPVWEARPNEHSRRMGEWHARWAEAAYRVAKPSAYLLAFGGTRTVHRMTVALEDAGWVIRDMLVWGYASGFPKSKASLKPAWEPIVMARKPGPLRMLAIDECRIGVGDEVPGGGGWVGGAEGRVSMRRDSHVDDVPTEPHTAGRWPANIVLTDPIFDGGWDGVVGGGQASDNPAGVFGVTKNATGRIYGNGDGVVKPGLDVFGYGDSGTYSRFFILPKADRSDREPVLTPNGHDRAARFTTHPTVKPTDLMRHLVRLVTPAGGVVLDPFLGSGTTGIAAEMEGFDWIGIEREEEYVRIAEARLNGTQRGLGLAEATA